MHLIISHTRTVEGMHAVVEIVGYQLSQHRTQVHHTALPNLLHYFRTHAYVRNVHKCWGQ